MLLAMPATLVITELAWVVDVMMVWAKRIYMGVGNFLGHAFFFPPLLVGCAWYVLVGNSLCKIFLKSQTQDLDSRRHLLYIYFPHGSPCTKFFSQPFLLCWNLFLEIAHSRIIHSLDKLMAHYWKLQQATRDSASVHHVRLFFFLIKPIFFSYKT